jgi:ribonuclease R
MVKSEKKIQKKQEVYQGSIQKNRRGFAFVIFQDRKREDLFLPPPQAARFFHADEVQVSVHRGKPKVRLRKHTMDTLLGRYLPPKRGKPGMVIYERKHCCECILVPKNTLQAKEHDWVEIKLHFQDFPPATGKMVQNFGPILPPQVDLLMITQEFSLHPEHSPKALQEAKRCTFVADASREDLTSLPFITIDGEQARDFDDAIFVEKTSSGYTLWVAIADVSHYVREGSALDQEAFLRSTSIYFPEKAFHMLPAALSEGLCSLQPEVPRLALVAQVCFDSQGNRGKTSLMEAVIRSRRRATYHEVQKERDAALLQKNKSWELRPHFELYEKLKEQRIARGSIDFDFPEPEILLDDSCDVVSILARARLESHKLIEELMIATNEAVTQWMMEKHKPFLYRVHEAPSVMALEKFAQWAASLGIATSAEKLARPKACSALVRSVLGTAAEPLIHLALLRSMKQAVYSAKHAIHYGLASKGYTHFTSPIRRYPDLVVHRLIRNVLKKQGKQKNLQVHLASIALHCSHQERLATEAEREAIKIKQVRALACRLGEVFSGKVSGMHASGIFVQIQNPFTEGMIPFHQIPEDHFLFEEEKMRCMGQRTKKVLKIGMPVEVRVIQADLERRQMEFELLNFFQKKRKGT